MKQNNADDDELLVPALLCNFSSPRLEDRNLEFLNLLDFSFLVIRPVAMSVFLSYCPSFWTSCGFSVLLDLFFASEKDLLKVAVLLSC